jgi:hypothetical protein
MAYHFKNSRASVQKDEPVYLTKFVTTWVLPAPLQAKYGGEIINEQIKKMGGLATDKLPENVEQFYRAHKRRYAGTVVETNIDIDMTFEVNVDSNNVMYPYNIMKDWCKLIYDPQTGFQSLKKDYTGSVTIEIHDKIGNVLKNVYFPIIFPITPPNAFDLEYNNEAIYEMSLTFAGENETDLIVGTP